MSTPARSRVSGAAGGHEVVVVSRNARQSSTTSAARRRLPSIFPGRLLPVFVMDRYEGSEPKFLQTSSEAERSAYVEANAAALRALLPADLVFTNHVLMGGPVGSGQRRPPFASRHTAPSLSTRCEGAPSWANGRGKLLRARTADLRWLEHIREVLADVIGHTERVFNVSSRRGHRRFVLQDRGAALEDLLAEARKDPQNSGDERLPDDGTRSAWPRFSTGSSRSSFTSEADRWRKACRCCSRRCRGIDARLVCRRVRAVPLQRSNRFAPSRTLFTGPARAPSSPAPAAARRVTVVPSIFPEAFGMVAGRGCAAGSPPLVARHSGLAEVAAGLEEEYPSLRHLAIFETGDAPISARKLNEVLALSQPSTDVLRQSARQAVVDRWSWASIARRLLAPCRRDWLATLSAIMGDEQRVSWQEALAQSATTSSRPPISARTLFLILASFLEELGSGGIGVSQHFLTVAGAKRSRG